MRAKNENRNTHNAAMLKNQQIAMSRLARSKWRRDPIKERLLFLTGIGSSSVEIPDYVKYLEGILQEKHKERESLVVKSLAAAEVDREWLWRVTKDVDFTRLERKRLEEERTARAAANAEEQDRQGMLLAAHKEMDLYTVANRTYGLDAQRNVERVKENHYKVMKDNKENGVGYERYTWLLDLNEDRVEEMKALVEAKDARDVFVAAESIIQDIATVQDQEDEEKEEAESEEN